MNLAAPCVRLLVCGTADRGDDGAALAAVAHVLPRLGARTRGCLEVRRCTQLDPMDLIDISDGEACIVVDTVVGVEAGTTVTMPLSELANGSGVSPRSSHALPIDQVLGIAQAVRGALPDGLFVGIGGKWFGYGSVQSRAVRSGLGRFESAIEEAVRALAVAPVG